MLGLREFCSPGRQLLSSLAHRFAGYCLLTASRLQIAVQIVQFLCASLDDPFACRSFLSHSRQTLLCRRQLVLEFRQALRERRNAAAQLGGSLLIGLQALLSRGGLKDRVESALVVEIC